ncbi:MAG TPA: class I SAM-dependent methyltransferase [Chitinophagaceae bacterium]|nr:class I SAM-dependent methyltransferase [Chitinophagaceae bacterium]
MGLLKKIKDKNRKEQFEPGFFSIIFNPNYFNRRAIYSGIKKHSKKLRGQLLDFGCGEKPYAHLFEVEKYIGVDLEKNEGHNLSMDKIDVFYDGTKLPFPADFFDSVYASEVFEHIFNLEEILKDINRVHRSEGLLLITLPFVWPEHEMPNDFGRYTSAGIKSILSKCNYEIIAHEKDPGFFLSVIQLFATYVHHVLLPKSNTIKFILSPITIFPIHLLGLFFGLFFPKNKELYINHVILAKNIKIAVV